MSDAELETFLLLYKRLRFDPKKAPNVFYIRK